jgi:hypothetical protein
MRLAFALVLTAGLLAAGDARAQLFLNGVQQPVPPVPCGAVPAMDTLNGSPGSTNCFVPRDATRPTAVQAANVITINTGSLPLVCNVVSRSATGATGKCWQSTTTTLGGTLVGLLVNPFGSPAASAAVMVIGREPTQ